VSVSASLPGRRRRVLGVPPAVGAAIVVAWALAIAAEVTGRAALLGHGALIEGRGPSQPPPPAWVAVPLFLAAWQVMVMAMMLPSSLPLVVLFRAASGRAPGARAAMAAFLGGYVVVWTAFGALAFLLDIGIHRLVDRTPWLASHPYVIGGATLVLAGAFQFSALKDRCLRECRRPEGFLLGRYARGLAAAFRLGREHGLYCLGCCWALMLLMFAAGVANLVWMGALTLVMVIEKTLRAGDRAAGAVGFALIILGALVLAHQPHLSALFQAR
jgi:predicted metal-binding membrane protein